jgi:hypothetical protein
VKSTAAREIPSISLEEIERWAKWALEQADRIDPVRSALSMLLTKVTTRNKRGAKCGVLRGCGNL